MPFDKGAMGNNKYGALLAFKEIRSRHTPVTFWQLSRFFLYNCKNRELQLLARKFIFYRIPES